MSIHKSKSKTSNLSFNTPRIRARLKRMLILMDVWSALHSQQLRCSLHDLETKTWVVVIEVAGHSTTFLVVDMNHNPAKAVAFDEIESFDDLESVGAGAVVEDDTNYVGEAAYGFYSDFEEDLEMGLGQNKLCICSFVMQSGNDDFGVDSLIYDVYSQVSLPHNDIFDDFGVDSLIYDVYSQVLLSDRYQKARIKLLEDKDGGVAEQSGDDALIKGMRLDEGEEAAGSVSDDTEEMATVLTSTDAVSILTSGGVQVVPTAAEVATATLEEEMERDAQRMNEQIARDAEIAQIHAEEELQILIGRLDRNDEVIAKHLQEYYQVVVELTIKEKIELINELVKYQDHHSKILKYQAQQSKPLTKRQ
nr:hypothetical protein [Tanacetum cinerariifolium]